MAMMVAGLPSAR